MGQIAREFVGASPSKGVWLWWVLIGDTPEEEHRYI